MQQEKDVPALVMKWLDGSIVNVETKGVRICNLQPESTPKFSAQNILC
jgi:hypothetical protein